MSGGQPIIVNPSLRQFEVAPLGTPVVTNATEVTVESTMAKTAGSSMVALHSSVDVDSKENIKPVGFVTVDPITGEPVPGQLSTLLPQAETAGLVPAAQAEQPLEEEEEEGEAVDIVINNVVCCFSVRCHLNLKKIAMEGMHVVYKRQHGMVSMKIRRPYTTASIWSSGKITVTGATSEDDSKRAARKIARILQTQGYRVKFGNFRIVNVLGTCSLPFGIKITHFSRDHPKNASYEPELHPGVTYKIKEPKATLKIFSTGSITVTAPCVANIQLAIEHIFPLVSEYKMEKKSVVDFEKNVTCKYMEQAPRAPLHRDNFRYKRNRVQRDEESDEYSSEESSEDLDSDTSDD